MDEVQQIISKLSPAKSVLIIATGTNGDSLAASLALGAFLRKLEKEVTLLSYTEVSAKFGFLPESSQVQTQIDLTKSLVINVATKKIQVAELSYKKTPEQLSIILKPSKGEFTSNDITFDASNFPFDLVVMVGITGLEQLGEFYSRNAQLFFQTPVINIDFRPSNENYGLINFIDLTATSCSEIILDLINKFEGSLIDENIATQLLTGIIAETNSFQHIRTTPQVFLKASQLVSLGAKQQEIVGHLYKSKSLGLLKLWGRVLARLSQDFDNLLVYSQVNQSDLAKAGATEEDARAIIKEMASQLSFAKIFLFLKEDAENQTTVFLQSIVPINLAELFSRYQPQVSGPQTIKFVVPDSVLNAEKLVLSQLGPQAAKFNGK
ncbi:MAG: hypothetical protein ABI643_01475 [Candidatus Doudnabacteria bacterium]